MPRITYAEKPGGFSAYTLLMQVRVSFSRGRDSCRMKLALLVHSHQTSWGLNLTAFLNDIEELSI